MSTFVSLFQNIFSNDNVKNILPSYSRNVNIMYQTKEVLNKLTWEKDFEAILDKKHWPSKENKKILKLLILKGMDLKYRPDLWFLASGAKREMSNNRGYYNFLINEYPDNFPSPCINQIELDLHRTFPEDEFFHDIKVIKKLRNILLAFSRRNVSIGYVQGFNFIVGRILKVITNEESAFWIFCQIIEYILPINYFSEMSGLMVDIDLLINLMNNYFPELISYMEENLFLDYFKNILFQWFISLFIQNFNEECSFLVWDILLIDRNIVLFKVVIGMIKLIKKELMQIQDLEKFKNFIKDKFCSFQDKSYLMYILILRKFEFNMEIIEKNRNLLFSIIVDKINNINKNKIEKRKEKLKLNKTECDSAWQICLYDIESCYTVREYFIYRTNENPLISEKHFDENMIKFNKILTSYLSENVSTKSNSTNNKNTNESKDTRKIILLENNIKNPFINKSKNENYTNNTPSHKNIDYGIQFYDFNLNKNLKDLSFKNFSYNNYLIERRDHLCVFKYKDKTFQRCSICLYSNEDDDDSKFSDQYDTKSKNSDNSVKYSNLVDDNNSSNQRRLDYRNKRKNKINNDFISTITYNQFQKKKKKEYDFQEFIINLNAKFNLMSEGKNFNLADFDVKKKLESDAVSLDSNIDN